MMKRKWKPFLVVLIVLSMTVVALTGCGTTETVREVEIADEDETRVVSKFTPEEEEAFIQQFAEKVLAFEDSVALTRELEENIARLSAKEAIHAIDGLMYVIYNEYYRTEMSEDFYEVARGYVEEGVNLNSLEEVEKLEVEDFALFVTQKLMQGYHFPVLEGEVTFQINYRYIVDKFGDYMGTDMIDLMNFYHDEGLKYFVNRDADALYYDTVAERILLTERLVEKHPESGYLDAFVQSNNFYTQLYFGALDFNYVFDDEMRLLEDAKLHMEAMLKEHDGTVFAKKVESFLDKIEASDWVKTEDVEVFLLDLTNVDYRDYDPDIDDIGAGSEFDEDGLKYDLEDAIQSIIDGRSSSDN